MTYFSELSRDEKETKSVGLLGFDGLATLDLTGPLEAFAAAHTEDGSEPCYEVFLIGVTGRTFATRSGATFKAQHTLRTAPVPDTIIIPGGPGVRNPETSRIIADWLLGAGKEVRRVASVSTGIYPLAQSGLLDGRRVTTHWRLAQNVALTFRRLEVSDTGSFIKDGRFYTCGGGTAGIEMSLALIEEDYGTRIALSVARELMVSLRPSDGGDRHIDPVEEQAAAEERLAELPAWITSRLRANLSVEVLAERACLCPRHFSRLFKRTFRSTPADFVEQMRIAEAARRLASQRLSIDGVANSVGFRSADVFRRAFERRLGVTPRNFQKENRANSRKHESVTHRARNMASAK